MNNDYIIETVKKMAEAEIAKLALGVSLVDVEYVNEQGNNFLRIIIDKANGIELSDCAKVSEKIGKMLDKEDTIQDSYYLEVCSAGIVIDEDNIEELDEQ